MDSKINFRTVVFNAIGIQKLKSILKGVNIYDK